MENTLIIKIPNFKLKVFRSLLTESLMADNQLMLEFSTTLIKSCSFSNTKTFMKLWTIPLSNLIVKEEKEGLIDFDEVSKDSEELVFPDFNFYILKGDLFKKYISVHNSVEMCDIEFTLHNINDKYCAADIKITGKTENNSPLVTTFVLTTEELISNKIDDYRAVLKECTPDANMFEFTLTDMQMQEIKRLTKQLHNSSPDNSAFLTFNVDFTKNKIAIKDKVFKVEYDLLIDANKSSEVKNNFDFNILKSDFIMTGNHTFTIYTNDIEEKIIFGANYASSIIWCLSSKIKENALELNDNILDATIDSLNLGDYNLDDLPF